MSKDNPIIEVKCFKCGHISHYTKQSVCPHDGTVVRRTVMRGRMDLDELWLACQNVECGEDMVVEVDCRGYK